MLGGHHCKLALQHGFWQGGINAEVAHLGCEYASMACSFSMALIAGASAYMTRLLCK